jgi:hypothetical protein
LYSDDRGRVAVANILSSSRQDLHGTQLDVWTKTVQDVGLQLDPYTCKASYVCGMVRQFIEAAGLQLRREVPRRSAGVGGIRH